LSFFKMLLFIASQSQRVYDAGIPLGRRKARVCGGP
jgi:hypothetical protein